MFVLFPGSKFGVFSLVNGRTGHPGQNTGHPGKIPGPTPQPRATPPTEHSAYMKHFFTSRCFPIGNPESIQHRLREELPCAVYVRKLVKPVLFIFAIRMYGCFMFWVVVLVVDWLIDSMTE